MIKLKYPVLLVHGSALRDRMLGIHYWGRIPAQMEANGARVYYGGTDAWGSIEDNARILKNNIEKLIAEKGAAKINIIAHSRGGLEARYLISSLGFRAAASLTTIATPHRGVKAMNAALRIPDVLYKPASLGIDLLYKALGDTKSDFYTSSRQLSEKACAVFNQINADNESVYYQSYAARIRHFYDDPLYMFFYPLVKRADGENDGVCPVESAKWGVFRGVIPVSHAAVIDLYKKNKPVDIPGFYVSILEGLSKKGF
jgi:triacylglycerol lipase